MHLPITFFQHSAGDQEVFEFPHMGLFQKMYFSQSLGSILYPDFGHGGRPHGIPKTSSSLHPRDECVLKSNQHGNHYSLD